MSDDIKLQVGLDLDALKISAERGAGLLGQAFQNAMSSIMNGQTLGSGLPPQQAAPGTGHADQMLSALEGIQQILQAGFSALVQAGGGGGGGGGSSGGAGNGRMPSPNIPTPPGATPPPYKTPDHEVAVRNAAGIANMFPQQAWANAYQGGFHGTDNAQFAAQATSSIPIIGQFMNMVAGTLSDRDQFLMQSLNMFRSGGKQPWANFRNMSTSDSGHQLMYNTGLDINEIGGLMRQQSSYGRSGGALQGLAGLEGRLGMGSQGVGWMQALMHGGERDVTGAAKNSDIELRVFGEVIAGAIASNLDRGRWGEAFTALTKAAQRISSGNIDREALQATESFVNQLGGRFLGDTSAHSSLVGTLQGMQGGQGGGLANILALQAGGLGQDGYFSAQARVDLGAAEGGVSLTMLLERYKSLPFVRRYLQTGTESDLNRAYILLSRMMPQFKATDIKEALRSMRIAMPHGLANEDIYSGMQQVANTNLPLNEFQLRQSQIKKGSEWSEAAIGTTNVGALNGVDNASDNERLKNTFRNTQGEVVDPSSRTTIGGVRDGAIDDPDHGYENYGDSVNYVPDPSSKNRPGWVDGYRPPKPGEAHHHMARDIAMPPGSRVYSPVNGTWLTDGNGSWASRSHTDGHVGELLSDNGVLFRFVHIASFNSALKRNTKVKVGTFIGTTADLGKGKTSHLHLEAYKGGRVNMKNVVDPRSQYGAGEDAIMRQGPPQPTPRSTTQPSEGPVMTPSVGAGQGAGAPPPNATSMNEGGVHRVEHTISIQVHDTRVAVRRATKNASAPGQLFNKRSV